MNSPSSSSTTSLSESITGSRSGSSTSSKSTTSSSGIRTSEMSTAGSFNDGDNTSESSRTTQVTSLFSINSHIPSGYDGSLCSSEPTSTSSTSSPFFPKVDYDINGTLESYHHSHESFSSTSRNTSPSGSTGLKLSNWFAGLSDGNSASLSESSLKVSSSCPNITSDRRDRANNIDSISSSTSTATTITPARWAASGSLNDRHHKKNPDIGISSYKKKSKSFPSFFSNYHRSSSSGSNSPSINTQDPSSSFFCSLIPQVQTLTNCTSHDSNNGEHFMKPFNSPHHSSASLSENPKRPTLSLNSRHVIINPQSSPYSSIASFSKSPKRSSPLLSYCPLGRRASWMKKASAAPPILVPAHHQDVFLPFPVVFPHPPSSPAPKSSTPSGTRATRPSQNLLTTRRSSISKEISDEVRARRKARGRRRVSFKDDSEIIEIPRQDLHCHDEVAASSSSQVATPVRSDDDSSSVKISAAAGDPWEMSDLCSIGTSSPLSSQETKLTHPEKSSNRLRPATIARPQPVSVGQGQLGVDEGGKKSRRTRTRFDSSPPKSTASTSTLRSVPMVRESVPILFKHSRKGGTSSGSDAWVDAPLLNQNNNKHLRSKTISTHPSRSSAAFHLRRTAFSDSSSKEKRNPFRLDPPIGQSKKFGKDENCEISLKLRFGEGLEPWSVFGFEDFDVEVEQAREVFFSSRPHLSPPDTLPNKQEYLPPIIEYYNDDDKPSEPTAPTSQDSIPDPASAQCETPHPVGNDDPGLVRRGRGTKVHHVVRRGFFGRKGVKVQLHCLH